MLLELQLNIYLLALIKRIYKNILTGIKMINLTEKAAVKIKQISDDDSLGHYVVRIKTIGGGCAGMTNDMFYDDQISETDEISELDGVKIICDFLSFQY